MILKRLKKFAFITACMFVANNVSAQDLLANQAPIDRKMKAVDSVMMQQLINNEVWENPAAELYEEWDNIFTHNPSALPDTFRINLRDFCMPTTNRVVTSNFGARWGRQHKGLDVKVYIGDTIRAAFSGKVRIVRYEARGYGKYVVIRHNNGLETIYGHMSKQLVSENQEVRAGDPIGLGGNTGRSTGSHLHFETRLCGVALNPAIMFDFKNQDVVADEWIFRRSTYNKESSQATRLRGTGGVYRGGDGLYADASSNSKASKHQAQQSRYHKVKKGETLSAIARKHRTSVNAICKLNRISQKVKLKPGQILKY
jgi:murein DD-endopeptidase MepM/ murein hydrolase activator NlpD